MQDAVLIDIALAVDRTLDVVFLDTGYHFAETWTTLRMVERRYGITVRIVRHDHQRPTTLDHPGACCDDKSLLLEKALDGKAAWFSGIRRTETSDRSEVPIVGTDRRGLVKISPLAQWNDGDVEQHILTNAVPVNPLLGQGYTSIGCATCTTVSEPGADNRSGRWAGTDKTECGLHL